MAKITLKGCSKITKILCMTVWHIIDDYKFITIIFLYPSTDCIVQSAYENQFSSPQGTETANYKWRATQHREWNY